MGRVAAIRLVFLSHYKELNNMVNHIVIIWAANFCIRIFSDFTFGSSTFGSATVYVAVLQVFLRFSTSDSRLAG